MPWHQLSVHYACKDKVKKCPCSNSRFTWYTNKFTSSNNILKVLSNSSTICHYEHKYNYLFTVLNAYILVVYRYPNIHAQVYRRDQLDTKYCGMTVPDHIRRYWYFIMSDWQWRDKLINSQQIIHSDFVNAFPISLPQLFRSLIYPSKLSYYVGKF